MGEGRLKSQVENAGKEGLGRERRKERGRSRALFIHWTGSHTLCRGCRTTTRITEFAPLQIGA